MIIVNQDKTEIVNFDNIIGIHIGNPLENTEGKFTIIAESEEMEYKLGQYKTEDVAKGVLNNIFVRYAMFECYKQQPFKVKQMIEEDFVKDDVAYNCFEMPEE